MDSIDKAELITWLAEKGYEIQSISDNSGMPGAGLSMVDGKVVQTKATTIVITKQATFTQV